MPLQLNPHIIALTQAIFGDQGPPPKPPVDDVPSRRVANKGFYELMSSSLPEFPDVDTKDFYTKAADGRTDIVLRWFQKRGSTGPLPAVVFAHGGGMISMAVDDYDKIIKRYTSLSGTPILAVDYRIAPESPAPGIVRDCYAGLEWLHAHASELNVDTNRIAVGGDSGGGGIAAALALYAKSQKGPKISKQFLLYPMLDDRTVRTDPEIAPMAVWNHEDNLTAWGAVLGDRRGTEDVMPYDAAGRMTVDDARGLPPVYIDFGQIDLFRDECLEYALKLSKAGVDCELHMFQGMTHAAENLIVDAEAAKQMVAARIAFLKSI
ncbi:alpha/beta hydrolase [Polychaeton citri CBS 116435]|uniref:Alpha/beta hydrolase n=1 Tax=Polychaeton citri CBS 116435 TaxID=1314669 RepID=A0A9P4ULK6_9PEZI|nr:alpha/beta hydrolase [Polychaeton citri CBS 116435]